jgi:hypothetical protein
MPVVQTERPRTLCPPGLYEVVLAEVTTQMMPAFSGDGEVERWLWRFVTNKRDENGQYIEIPVFTGGVYGNSRAKLTWLLDMIRPGITKAQADRLNTDDLIGSHFEAQVKHEQSVRDPETKVATFAYIRPAGNEGAPDPFAFADGAVEVCEECSAELSPAEIKACQKRWGDALRLCTRHGREAVQRDKEMAAQKATELAPA